MRLSTFDKLGLDPEGYYIIGSPMDDTPRFRRMRLAQPCDIPTDDRWCHVVAMTPGGIIYDCHTDESGVISYSLEDLINETRYDFYATPHPLFQVWQLECMMGVPTSIAKLRRYWHMRDGKYVKPIDDCGTTCSELLAYADGFNISRFAQKPPCNITPTDFQRWTLRQPESETVRLTEAKR